MNAPHYHVLVWIDHHEARLFHLGATDFDESVLYPDHPTKHIHHKANMIGSGKADEDQGYLRAVTDALSGAGAILVTGPAHEKLELVKFVRLNAPGLAKSIVGVETVARPSDGQLVAYGRKYFNAADRMRPQIG